MKTKLLLLLALLPGLLFAGSLSHREAITRLEQINAEWNKQPEANLLDKNILSHYQWQSENDVIQSHLLLVYQILKERKTHHLNTLQKNNRNKNLASLLRYALMGKFPVNNKINRRNPVFIDDFETFCAVGYLIKSSGFEWISREIQQNENLCYVKQIQNPNLKEWASNCGLSINELAWIQPGYMHQNYTKGVGKGVNGRVRAMEADTQNNLLYIGGSFSLCDSTIITSNLACIHVSGSNSYYTGFNEVFNGEFFALKLHQQQLYVGGEFERDDNRQHKNVMRWNGSTWFPMVGIEGKVLDLEVYRDTLYAAGKFTVSDGKSIFYNLAKWDGQHWLPVVKTDTGTLYTMTVFQDKLFIGGSVTKVDTQNIGYVFSWDGYRVDNLDGGVKATVLTLYPSTQTELLAGGVYINGNDTFGLGVFANGSWDFPIKKYYERINTFREKPFSIHYILNLKYINSIIRFDNNIILGGDIIGISGMYNSHYSAMLGPLPTSPINFLSMFRAYSSFDNNVNCMSVINHKLYFGGNHSLVMDGNGHGGTNMFNSAGMGMLKGSIYNSLPENVMKNHSTVSVFPVPSSNKNFKITGPYSIKKIEVIGSNGKPAIFHHRIDNNEAWIEVEHEGIYFLKVELADGVIAVKKVTSQ